MTGRVINDRPSKDGRITTIWYVHDRDYCYEVVLGPTSERHAQRVAFEMNAEERRWEKNEQATSYERKRWRDVMKTFQRRNGR